MLAWPLADVNWTTGAGERRIATVGAVVRFCHMGETLTVRLPKELAEWLERTAKRTGVSQGKIVRDQLEKARARAADQRFMRLAGVVRGPKDLSQRKGFSSR
jgi:predicted transcriptional regulator